MGGSDVTELQEGQHGILERVKSFIMHCYRDTFGRDLQRYVLQEFTSKLIYLTGYCILLIRGF